MDVLKVAAAVFFLLAIVGAFGWGVDWLITTVVGLIACGLLCLVASSLTIPQPPSR